MFIGIESEKIQKIKFLFENNRGRKFLNLEISLTETDSLFSLLI